MENASGPRFRRPTLYPVELRTRAVSSLAAKRRQEAQAYINRLVAIAAESSKERADFIADMMSLGVPPHAVYQGDRRLELAKALPMSRRIRAVVTISAWMLAQRDQARAGVAS